MNKKKEGELEIGSFKEEKIVRGSNAMKRLLKRKEPNIFWVHKQKSVAGRKFFLL